MLFAKSKRLPFETPRVRQVLHLSRSCGLASWPLCCEEIVCSGRKQSLQIFFLVLASSAPNMSCASQDLSGGNVLLTATYATAHGFRARISDFGLARKLLDVRSNVSTMSYGTMNYLAPEVVSDGSLSMVLPSALSPCCSSRGWNWVAFGSFAETCAMA